MVAIVIVAIVVGAFIVLPMVLEHRQEMARIKNDQKNK